MSEPVFGDATTIPAAFVYRWMAGLYLAPPDATALAIYRTPEGRELIEGLASRPALAPVAGELAALIAPDSDLDAAASRLAAAHAAAFLVGGRRAAPPYASVWLSERGLMFQEPARAMTRLLAATGLSLPQEVPEPADHIGFHLNLLAEIDSRQAEGVPTPITPETFVRDHMMTWLPAFAEACAGLRDPLLYAALAAATISYLSDEQ